MCQALLLVLSILDSGGPGGTEVRAAGGLSRGEHGQPLAAHYCPGLAAGHAGDSRSGLPIDGWRVLDVTPMQI